jgi:hypothetical protein
MAFRNNAFREVVLTESNGNLTGAQLLAGLAQQFGEATENAPYLRSGLNNKTMKSLADTLEPHALSEVMTGAMFDILKGIFAKHQKNELERAKADPSKKKNSKPSDKRALADTVPRMQMLAIQPLDLLPPCSVTFRDYALAVLRATQVTDPTDLSGYRELMLDCFIKRGVLNKADRKKLMAPVAVFKRPTLDVYHSVDSIAASRGGAYRFLDDNRAKLLIPLNANLIIPEIVRASKTTRDGLRQPDQIIVQYLWREELLLKGPRFGQFAGERTAMLCGATMVLDQKGNLIHWTRQPGSLGVGDPKVDNSDPGRADQAKGLRRRKELLDTIAARIAAGTIGETIGGELGLLERASPPFTVQRVDGELRFGLAPHFSLRGDADHDDMGDSQWQISY